jgi:hypothetical protein
LVFIVSYYSIEGFALVLACKRLGITSVDLQHGVQGPLHPAYSGLPRGSGPFQLLPDWFWVWSEEEAEAIDSWSEVSGQHRALVGGNPWLDLWLEDADVYVRTVNARVEAMRAEYMHKKIVLVTLQPGISNPQQLGLLRELIELAGDGWAWWIRLHPVMMGQRDQIQSALKSLRTKSVDLDRASHFPLYGLLRQVDVHLTHSSSTVIEAEKCGVASVITSLYGAEVYPTQIRRGMAMQCDDTASSTLTALEKMSQRKGIPATSSSLKSDALDTLLATSNRFGELD